MRYARQPVELALRHAAEAEKISIITSYNGQKALIKDILDARCANNPLFGLPSKVSTVDKYQGQQNDYILLSLVRTRSAGHIRDVRRLVVAMSRARLGLYVFCRTKLYQNCFELIRTFAQMLSRPTQLQLVANERSWDGTTARRISDPVQPYTVMDVTHMGRIVQEETVRTMKEHAEYQRRVAAYEAAEVKKREARERREPEMREAKDEIRRKEQEEVRSTMRDQEFEAETAEYDKEIATQVPQVSMLEEDEDAGSDSDAD